MFKNTIQIFSHWRYTALAVGVFWVVWSVALFFPHRELMTTMLTSNTFGFFDKVVFVGNMYGVISINFTLFTAIYTTLIAFLFGVNIAMMAYYIKRQRAISAGSTTAIGSGVGGVVAGFLGIGCASCGTFVLTGLLSFMGIGGILAFLPLKGQELGLLGLGLLMYSIYSINKKISAPQVCESITIK